MKKAHLGSNFDNFLQQEGLLAECEAGALRRVVTWQTRRNALAALSRRRSGPNTSCSWTSPATTSGACAISSAP